MMPFKIKTLYAFIGTESGREGVIAAQLGDTWHPLICADEARLNSYYPLAKAICTKSGKSVRLAKFSVREDIEDIKP